MKEYSNLMECCTEKKRKEILKYITFAFQDDETPKCVCIQGDCLTWKTVFIKGFIYHHLEISRDYTGGGVV